MAWTCRHTASQFNTHAYLSIQNQTLASKLHNPDGPALSADNHGRIFPNEIHWLWLSSSVTVICTVQVNHKCKIKNVGVGIQEGVSILASRGKSFSYHVFKSVWLWLWYGFIVKSFLKSANVDKFGIQFSLPLAQFYSVHIKSLSHVFAK